jgi:hypothetical protein
MKLISQDLLSVVFHLYYPGTAQRGKEELFMKKMAVVQLCGVILGAYKGLTSPEYEIYKDKLSANLLYVSNF